MLLKEENQKIVQAGANLDRTCTWQGIKAQERVTERMQDRKSKTKKHPLNTTLLMKKAHFKFVTN